METAAHPPSASYGGPPFDQAHVRDAMRVGVVTCRPETTLADASRMMVGYGIHSVVVSDPADATAAWGIVTALDVARASAEGRSSATAGEMASHEILTIPSDAGLHQAAKTMAEHNVSHLIAVQPETGQPVGVISALGLAAAAAGSLSG
jgi:CBS domain-containing protein